MVRALGAVADRIDRVNEAVGRAVSWLVLAMVLITFAVAILRYVFSFGLVWFQESYVWLHGIVFTAGAGYTLLHDGHVRVDVIYRPLSPRYRAVVDLLGGLVLLLPMVAAVAWSSLPYVVESWTRGEGSNDPGGLPAVYLLKSFLLVFCALVALQGVSLSIRSLLRLLGREDGR
jgi:TRAP-type mannitol/chloroaromatic compound transport system permease small subunit